MPSDPDRAQRAHPLQWFALSIAGGFFLSYFVYWIFAALFALSLGAVATGFDQARQGQRVSAWLSVPATGVFAFVTGSFVQGFAHPAGIDIRSRIVIGAAEAVLMMVSGGDVPLEGVERISPWPHVAVAWVAFTSLVLWVGRWRERVRARSSAE